LSERERGVRTGDARGRAAAHAPGERESFVDRDDRVVAERAECACAAIAAQLRSGSRGTRSASRPVTSAIFAAPFVSSTVTVSPMPSIARPRTSKPGPTLPMLPGAKAVARCTVIARLGYGLRRQDRQTSPSPRREALGEVREVPRAQRKPLTLTLSHAPNHHARGGDWFRRSPALRFSIRVNESGGVLCQKRLIARPSFARAS
jgi:hypothetical protein